MTAQTGSPTTSAADVLLEARGVSKYYGEAGHQVLVIDDVTLKLRAGEIVALLGPSGSGKSTMLRLLSGLLPPSSGTVLVHDAPLQGANPKVAIVFQTFALYPWLTVQENVELGLLAKDLPPAERRTRALNAIDMIGLDGFEEAFPRELSGGMRQRVGLARALVVEPEVLFLDEAFSALDVLVAENLRRELLRLWRTHSVPIRAILMVTHNIDEAVTMADRLLVFGANPGRVRVELPGLSVADRGPKSEARAQLVDTVYRIMTNPQADAATLVPGAQPVQPAAPAAPYQALPHISLDELAGFLERLHDQGGREDLYAAARQLQLEVDELLPLADAADMLDFADIDEGDIVLTDIGRRFVEADTQQRKQIFTRQVLERIAIVRQIERELGATKDGASHDDRYLTALEQTFSTPEARRQLDTAIDWGRYAELFAYDDETGELYLEDVEGTGN
jgi:NitT/TauT family transport system ATP-binding protein